MTATATAKKEATEAGMEGAVAAGGKEGEEEKEELPETASAQAAWDGVIVFDECHRAKGLKPGDSGGSSAVAVGGGGAGEDGAASFIGGGGRRRSRGGGGGGGSGGSGSGGSSKVSLAVVDLQARLPSARVLCTSATGISSLADCGYLVS